MNDGFADRPLKPLGHPHVWLREQDSNLRPAFDRPAYETGELGHYSIPRFCRSRRARTSDLRFWRPTFYQLNYAPIVEVAGLEPTKPNGGRFTVCSRCRWRTPHYILVEPRGVEPRSQDFQSCAYTKSAKVPLEEAKGFEPLGRFTALWFSRPVQ